MGLIEKHSFNRKTQLGIGATWGQQYSPPGDVPLGEQKLQPGDGQGSRNQYPSSPKEEEGGGIVESSRNKRKIKSLPSPGTYGERKDFFVILD